MSRSLSSALRRPFAPTACLGIAVQPSGVSAAYAVLHQGTWGTQWVRQEPLEAQLFTVAPNDASTQVLSRVLEKLAAEARGTWLPVQIALPDPLFHAAVFELDDVPKDARAREQLLAWRLKKDLHLADQSWAFRSQYLGEAGNKRLLLGVAVEQAWLAAIRVACQKAGITPTWIDMSSGFFFHRLHDQFVAGKDSALVVIDAAAWSIVLTDAAGRMRYIRSRWRRDDDVTEIAGDIERAARAYIRAGEGRAIERVRVSGEKKAGEALMEALRERLRSECTWIDMPPPKDGAVPTAMTAIAAAAYRE